MKRNEPTVARSTALMSVATLVSRVTGLARTWVMAFALGNTLVTSAYQVANTMPNMIYDLVAGGLLSAAFVPLYLLQTEKFGREGGNRYASNLLNIIILVMGVLSILGTVFAPQIIATQTFTQDYDAEVTSIAVGFFRIFAIQMLFYGIGGVVTSLLNAERVFFLPSIAPAFNNIVVILSFISYSFIAPLDFDVALIVLAIGTTLGVVVQMAVQLPALFKQGFKWEFRIDFRDPAFLDTVKTGAQMTIYLVGTLVALSFRNAFSLETGDNGPATLNYAWIWFQLPHGIIVVSLTRALFTEMSKSIAADNMPDFRRYMQSGLSLTLLIIIPLAGLMAVLSEPLMQIFQAGAFNAEDVAYVGAVLSVWMLALPFYSLQYYLFKIYAALRHFLVFSFICVGFVLVQCFLYSVLTSADLFGLIGICIADAVYYAASVVVLLFVLRRYVGNIGARHMIISAVKSLAATAVGLVLVWLALAYLPSWAGPIGGFFTVVLYGGLGLIVILALYQLLRVPEMGQLLGTVKRIIKRK